MNQEAVWRSVISHELPLSSTEKVSLHICWTRLNRDILYLSLFDAVIFLDEFFLGKLFPGQDRKGRLQASLLGGQVQGASRWWLSCLAALSIGTASIFRVEADHLGAANAVRGGGAQGYFSRSCMRIVYITIVDRIPI